MKLTIVTNVSNILEYKKIGANAFIFGLKNYSSGYNNELSLEEIEELRKNYDGELFIAINKNIFNSEIEELERSMVFLDKIGIDGILFYDLSVLSIKNRLNLSINLVWNQTHMVTNYNTCNYFNEKGCKYGYIASEITLEEINEIKEKSNMELFLNVLGYPIMSYSRRHLLDNYFKSINKDRINDTYTISNNGSSYIIKEEKHGNAIYYREVLNGSVVVPKCNVDYLVLNDSFMDSDLFSKCVVLFRKLIDTNDESIIKEIDDLVGDNRGFFFKKTIYKVKKND